MHTNQNIPVSPWLVAGPEPPSCQSLPHQAGRSARSYEEREYALAQLELCLPLPTQGTVAAIRQIKMIKTGV